MFMFHKQMRRVGLAAVAVGSIGLSGQAFAQNTPSGDTISNTATVNYTVSSVAQTPITASTSFTVDTIVRFNLTGGATVGVAPGQTNRVQIFTLTNTSNATSDFTLTGTNQAGDDFQMLVPSTLTDGVNVYVDTNTNGSYDPGTDLQVTTNISLARNASRTYFVVGDTPIAVANANEAIVRLQADAINPATSVAWVNNTGADVQGGVAQIVVGNATANQQGIFQVQTATLAVTKSSLVISDPINLTGAGRKAIPGAVVEYAIAVANSGSQAATLQNISDLIPANLTFRQGDYPGSTDVQIVGAATTYCVAESGADANADGCFVAGGTTLTVGAPAVTTVNTASTVTVRFRVTIQ
jgi:uncharacterized repeat protein (TIGR01451 family)